MVVTPSAISERKRAVALASNCASLAARVAATVARMPPPARAMSS